MHCSCSQLSASMGLGLLTVLAGCTEGDLPISRISRALSAICSVEVIKNGVSLGIKDVEQDYLPNVVNCESGDLSTEALKVQAVAARTYVYYKLASGGTQITSGTSVQVYDCARKIYLAQKHYDAVNATAGQILTYQGNPIWPCFNAGVSPTNPPCTPNTGVGADTCCTSNAGKSGSGITQSPCGFVDPTNYKNRGCICQNGADCYAKLGKNYTEIIKAYLGDDIGWLTVTGSCIKPTEAGGATLDAEPPPRDSTSASDGFPPASDRAADRPGHDLSSTPSGDGRREVEDGCSCRMGSAPGSLAARMPIGLALLGWLGLLGLLLRRANLRERSRAR